MRLLVVSQYFWPETFIINDVVRTLIEQGHEVVVATGKPNYPDGNIFEGYKAGGIQRERFFDRVEVVRVPLWPRGRGGAKHLILNYLSFVFAGLICFPWMLRGKKFDSILVFAPSPITQAIPAVALKWLKGAKLAIWVQDLWPESLSATGFISNRHLLRAVGWLVRGIYWQSDLLLVQSRAFAGPVSVYANQRKIIYYPNSIDAQKSTSKEELPPELLCTLNKFFCVVFAGNLGSAQALETLVQAAVHLQQDSHIRLVLIGSGSRLDWLKTQKYDLKLDNLVLPGRFEMDAMPPIFERASALLVSLSDQPAFAQTVPSKIQAYLAAGRPIVASINGEGARVVREAGAGLTSGAEQVTPLVENIRRISQMDEHERAAMGKAGRAFFEANFDMSNQVAKLVDLLR